MAALAAGRLEAVVSGQHRSSGEAATVPTAPSILGLAQRGSAVRRASDQSGVLREHRKVGLVRLPVTLPRPFSGRWALPQDRGTITDARTRAYLAGGGDWLGLARRQACLAHREREFREVVLEVLEHNWLAGPVGCG